AGRGAHPADSPALAAERAPRGEALMDIGAYAEAEPLLLLRYRGLRLARARDPHDVDPRLRDAGARLAEFYDAWGKPDEAAKWRKELEAPGTPRHAEPTPPLLSRP